MTGIDNMVGPLKRYAESQTRSYLTNPNLQATTNLFLSRIRFPSLHNPAEVFDSLQFAQKPGLTYNHFV